MPMKYYKNIVITVALLCLFILSSNSNVEARLCNIGAELFYQKYKTILPFDYQYTTLNNYISTNNYNMYEFGVRNKNTKKSHVKIWLKIDDSGYIDEISMKYSLADSELKDIKAIQENCFQSLGITKDEILWLSSHEQTIPVARNEEIKHSEVYSWQNGRVIYVHEIPFEGGLQLFFIDGKNLEEFIGKWIKPYVVVDN